MQSEEILKGGDMDRRLDMEREKDKRLHQIVWKGGDRGEKSKSGAREFMDGRSMMDVERREGRVER